MKTYISIIVVSLVSLFMANSAWAECEQVGIGPKNVCWYETRCTTDASAVQYGGVVETTCNAVQKVCQLPTTKVVGLLLNHF
jgi:hypothetical protein